MTLSEIEANLPNGFHDAEIEELVWNYRNDSASFTMKLLVPEATDKDIEIYRLGRLDVKRYCIHSNRPSTAKRFRSKTVQAVWVIADRWNGNHGNNISRLLET